MAGPAIESLVTPHAAFILFQQHVYAGVRDLTRNLVRHVRQFTLAGTEPVHQFASTTREASPTKITQPVLLRETNMLREADGLCG